MKITNHGGGLRIEKTYAQAYCRRPDCEWIGPERPSVSEARADSREHSNPSKPVVIGVHS